MRSGMRSWSKCVIFSRRMKSSSSVGPRSPAFSEFWLSAMATPWLVVSTWPPASARTRSSEPMRRVHADRRRAAAGLVRGVRFAQRAGRDGGRGRFSLQALGRVDGVVAADLQRLVGVPRHRFHQRLRGLRPAAPAHRRRCRAAAPKACRWCCVRPPWRQWRRTRVRRLDAIFSHVALGRPAELAIPSLMKFVAWGLGTQLSHVSQALSPGAQEGSTDSMGRVARPSASSYFLRRRRLGSLHTQWRGRRYPPMRLAARSYESGRTCPTTGTQKRIKTVAAPSVAMGLIHLP